MTMSTYILKNILKLVFPIPLSPAHEQFIVAFKFYQQQPCLAADCTDQVAMSMLAVIFS